MTDYEKAMIARALVLMSMTRKDFVDSAMRRIGVDLSNRMGEWSESQWELLRSLVCSR